MFGYFSRVSKTKKVGRFYMSQADADKFLLKAQSGDVKKEMEDNHKRIKKIAKGLGLSFTAKELEKALRDRWDRGDQPSGVHFCISEPPGE